MPPDIEDELDTNTDAPLSLRDSLEQALETTSEPAQPVELEQQPAEPAEGETQEQADQRARDAEGRFAKAPKKPAAAKPPAAVKTVVKPAVELKPTLKPGAPPVVRPGTVPTSAQAPAVPEMKPPQAWRGPAKEVWGQLPEAARVEVLRREKEITTQLATAGEDRKYAGTMKAAFAPFEAQIRAEGSTPDQAIGKLMGTAMLLRTGPAHLKAQAVADMISTYGVPLEGLVAALQGRQVQPGQHQQQASQQVDPAQLAAQVEQQLMQRLAAQRDTSLATKFEAETEKFLADKAMHGLDGTDYGEEIKDMMADVIERAVKRGSTITLEKAYILAAREHPEVSKVLERQQAAASAVKANASTQRARAAASSVRHQSATEPVGKTDTSSIRSSLEAAVERHSG